MTLSDFPDVGTVDQVAEVTTFNRKTVYRAIELGELPAVRRGRAIRVTRVALCRWLGISEQDLVRGVADG